MKSNNLLIRMIALGLTASGLSGCSFMHVHNYDAPYMYDQTKHWQVCDECNEEINADSHSFNEFNNTCVFCGYVDPVLVISNEGVVTGLTEYGKQKYEIDIPSNVRFITADAFKDSKVTKINIPKEFVGYYEGALDFNNINVATDEEKVMWDLKDGIYYKHNILEEYEATIGDKCFVSLRDALESIHKDDVTVTLMKQDIKINQPIRINSAINLESYYETSTLECNFQIAASGILKIDSSITYKGKTQLILADAREELDDSYQNVYKSGTISFIDKETEPEDVYVEYVKTFMQDFGFGNEAVGSKQVVNSVLVIPVTQYAYGTFAFSKDFKLIMGLSAYGDTVTELHITNVVKNIDAAIADYAFAVWTDIKINIAVIDDTHITYYQTKGSFTSLYVDEGITRIGDRAFSNEMTEDVFHEVRIMLSLLCKLKSLYVGDSVTTIGENAFATSLGLEKVSGGRGLKGIGKYAFYECLNLDTVDFSEAFNLVMIWEYAFASCDHLVNLSLPRDGWTVNGQTFVAHQLTPEVASYHAVHCDVSKKWTRTVLGRICYTRSLSKEGCGKFIDVAYTDVIADAVNHCCVDGWVYILEADETIKHVPITNVTKNIHIVAYNQEDKVSVGTDEEGLTVEKNHYITLENVRPRGKVLINCDITKYPSTDAILFGNNASICIKSDNREVLAKTKVYFSDPATKEEYEARPTYATFREGIEYGSFGLMSFSYSSKDKKILFNNHSILFNSITKYTAENPIYESDEIKINTIGMSNDLFKNNQTIRFLTMSDAITSMGIYVFADCKNLERVTFGNSINYILSNAFEGCTKLKRVEFGLEDTLTSIGADTFTNCTALEYFDFNGNISDWIVDAPTPVTITIDQLVDPYNAAELIKQYSQYRWHR